MRHAIRTRRHGFTLVELLVAAALTMLIMSILALSFQTAMDSLSHLRAAGEMQDRLRTAGEKIRIDLQAPHFEDEAVKHGMVSHVRFDRNPNATPAAGFFRIDQIGPATEENGIATSSRDYSTRAANHFLEFSVKLPGTNRQSIFTAPRVPNSNAAVQGLDDTHDNLIRDASTYGSRWAVVQWFLAPSGEATNGPVAASHQPLYTLHRRVRLLAEVKDSYINPGNPNSIHYVHNPATGLVLTARDVAKLTDRPAVLNSFTAPTYANFYTPLGDGSDIVLSNVLSFEVKADYSPVLVTAGALKTLYPRTAADPATLFATYGVTPAGTDTVTTPAAQAVSMSSGFNFDFPFDHLPKNPFAPAATPTVPNLRHFDTGEVGGTNIGQQYQVKSLQIKLRIYDPKTMNTRQVTLVQDL